MSPITLGELGLAIRNNSVRITDHADEEMAGDALTLERVCQTVIGGEIIESYPDDRPYPSCLALGFSVPGNHPVHSVWGYNRVTGFAILITVYRPDPERWIDWRIRRA